MTTLHPRYGLLAGLLAVAALSPMGCSRAGMGDAVRADITERMATTETPIAACYHAALQKNRKLRGRMVVSCTAAPSTGAFTDVRLVSSNLGDKELESCVLTAVGALALATPQKTSVAATYPLDFSPVE